MSDHGYPEYVCWEKVGIINYAIYEAIAIAILHYNSSIRQLTKSELEHWLCLNHKLMEDIVSGKVYHGQQIMTACLI